MMTTAQPLTIAIVGVGQIGSAFAYWLAKAGHNVTAIARPDSTRLFQLRRDSGILLQSGKGIAVKISDQLDETLPYDLVIVTTLAYQAALLIPILKRSKASCIHFMFNTFDPQRLAKSLGAQRCTFGMPFIMATHDNDGRLDAQITHKRPTLHGGQEWVDLFDKAGIPSQFELHMLAWLVSHVPLCIAMEAISIGAKRRGNGASWRQAQAVARGLKGTVAVIKGIGVPIYPPSKNALYALPTLIIAGPLWNVSRVKSFTDLLATGVDECRELIDGVISSAQMTNLHLVKLITALVVMKPEVRAFPDHSAS
jgi:2-dehydropantoate 2-reductase